MVNLKRKCPKCSVEIIYKTLTGYNNATMNKSVCRRCASSGENNGMYGKTGDKNPFYGKKHTKETLEKQSKIKLGKKHTDETIDKLKKIFSGDKNPMYGKSVFSLWVERYGEIVALEKLNTTKKIHSVNNSGDGNPMYGKPSPTGSGNGWSGWYKGWYFRSLRELTYMVKVIERFGFKWESGELNKWKIKYVDYKGSLRNYFPDFILNDKYVIECKPKKLWNSDSVIRKTDAALKFCENNSLKYRKVDIGVLSSLEIKELYESGLIKFLPRYEEKFIKRYK
jgi:hypothetical protein